MKIVIRSEKVNLTLPVPLKMASIAIRKIPDSVFDGFREKLPPEYAKAVCKENLSFVIEECRPELEAFKGLELVNAKKEDGTFVSIVL